MSPVVDIEMHGYDDSATLPGALAGGLAAGAVMMLVWMIGAALRGSGFWTPPALVAGTFYGPAALVAGAPAVVTGLFLHFGFALAWGLLWASSLQRRWGGLVTALATGLCYGGFTFLVAYYVIAPWGDPLLWAQVPVWFFFVTFLFYGATLALWAPLVTSRRASPRG